MYHSLITHISFSYQILKIFTNLKTQKKKKNPKSQNIFSPIFLLSNQIPNSSSYTIGSYIYIYRERERERERERVSDIDRYDFVVINIYILW